MDEVGFALAGGGDVVIAETDGTMADAFPLFGIDACLTKDVFAFFGLELFIGSMDPDAVNSQGVGSKHEVAHDKGAIVLGVAPSGFCQDNNHHGGAIEGVNGWLAPDLGVHTADLIAKGTIGDDEHLGVLESASVGGVFAALKDEVDLFVGGELFGVEAAAGATLEEGLYRGICHDILF